MRNSATPFSSAGDADELMDVERLLSYWHQETRSSDYDPGKSPHSEQIPHRLVFNGDTAVSGRDADNGVPGGVEDFGERAVAGPVLVDECVDASCTHISSQLGILKSSPFEGLNEPQDVDCVFTSVIGGR